MVSRATRTEQKKTDKRERLRDAAWELFTKHGFAATTTKQIAEKAGVASGTLFLYARDKGDLLFLVFHERLSHAVDHGMRTLPSGPLLDQLMHLFEGFFAVYEQAPDVARAFIKELPGADGPNAQQVNQLTMALLHHVAALIQRAQSDGKLDRDVPSLLLAHNVFALYYSALHAWLAGFSTFHGAIPLLRSSLELQLRGLER